MLHGFYCGGFDNLIGELRNKSGTKLHILDLIVQFYNTKESSYAKNREN